MELIVTTREDLKQIVSEAVNAALQNRPIQSNESTQQPFIKGIHELAKFLNVSPARAQKLKNENAFPYWQDGRTLLFDPYKVRQAMVEVKTGKGGRKR